MAGRSLSGPREPDYIKVIVEVRFKRKERYSKRISNVDATVSRVACSSRTLSFAT